MFEDLNLSTETLAAIETLDWDEPTPIQRQGIPPGLDGEDVVGIAETGTGKTGAFIIPVLERIESGGGLQVLAVCPTRELAQQVADDAAALARGRRIRVDAIYGGVGYEDQNHALDAGFEIIAATPGRFIDHLEHGRAKLDDLRVLILDEADRLLDMGFRPQIEKILDRAPRERQTMLFSATMPNAVHALALRVTDEPVWIEIAPLGKTAENLEEVAYSVKPGKKPELLMELLRRPDWDQVLVFTRTKAGADVLEVRLREAGIRSTVMHGDKNMSQRTGALDRFAEGDVRVLVATDVAQRGLDIEGISHVVNYDVPFDPEDYIHRIGRTARAGAAGTAVTFVEASDLGRMKAIERLLDRPVPRVHMPEYDYAGGEREKVEAPKRSRTGGAMGARSADDLSREELEELLRVG